MPHPEGYVHLRVASVQVDPSFGMSFGQPAGPDGLPQYHSGGIGMHAPPMGGHCEHVQICPSGYPHTE